MHYTDQALPQLRKMFCDPWESLAHGHWWFYQWESLCSLIHVDQRPLIWEVRNFLLDDFSNSEVNKLELLHCHLHHLPDLRLLLELRTTYSAKDSRGQRRHCFKLC